MKQPKGLGRGLDAIFGGDAIDLDAKLKPMSRMAEIDIADIIPNPSQPRTQFDEEALDELADSIRQLGVIQPVTVRKSDNGKYIIISGERRWRAAQRADLKTLPAYIREVDDETLYAMALVENIQRQDLNAIEIALGMQRLIDECHLTQDALSERVGKKRSSISNYLRLLKLPDEVQLALKEGLISMGHAKAIAGAPADQQVRLLKKSIKRRCRCVRSRKRPVRSPSNRPARKQPTKRNIPKAIRDWSSSWNPISRRTSPSNARKTAAAASSSNSATTRTSTSSSIVSLPVRNLPHSQMKRFRSLSFAFALLLCTSVAEAQPPVQVQLRRGGRTVVRGGQPERPDSLRNKRDSMQMAAILLELDSLQQTDFRTDSIALAALRTDDIRTLDSTTQARLMAETPTASVTRKPLLKKGWFMSDSMSLSKVCWLSTVLPGYGQIYNKQYWKLPILYGALGTGLALYIHENNTYKPLKRQYEAYTDISTVRTPELNALQTRMIRSNTRRQLYLGLTVASYIYFIGDAAVSYHTNDVSSVKRLRRWPASSRGQAKSTTAAIGKYRSSSADSHR